MSSIHNTPVSLLTLTTIELAKQNTQLQLSSLPKALEIFDLYKLYSDMEQKPTGHYPNPLIAALTPNDNSIKEEKEKKYEQEARIELFKYFFKNPSYHTKLHSTREPPIVHIIQNPELDITFLKIIINTIKEKKLDQIKYRDAEENNLLHIASLYGNLEALELLIENENEKVDPTNMYGETPLMLAASRGNEACVNYLIKKNADVTKISNHKSNLLHYAAEGDMVAFSEELIKYGLPTNDPNAVGKTPRHYTSNPELEKLLDEKEKKSFFDN